MIIDALLTLGGLVLLFAGGESVVRGAVALAFRMGISPLIVGLTVVAFGTSAPEIVTSVEAVLADAPAIAVGNIVGSNIANVLLVLGLSALVRPMLVYGKAFRRDAWAVLVATLIGIALLFLGFIDRAMGAALLALLAGYLLYAYRCERQKAGQALSAGKPQREGEADKEGEHRPHNVFVSVAMTAGGIVLVIVGARCLVEGAVGIARAAEISEATIGATVVAVGTSLPEVVTSVIAARRGQSGVAIGNVLGSNLFNILGVLGAAGLAAPFRVAPEILTADVWIMFFVTVVLWFLATRHRLITRWDAAALLAGYAGFLLLLFGW